MQGSKIELAKSRIGMISISVSAKNPHRTNISSAHLILFLASNVWGTRFFFKGLIDAEPMLWTYKFKKIANWSTGGKVFFPKCVEDICHDTQENISPVKQSITRKNYRIVIADM